MHTKGRRAELDGLRGVAILLVLIGHAGVDYQIGSLAAAGVTLFFALSGYLITDILRDEHKRSGKLDLRRFYARRLTRLGPPLFVMLAVTGLILTPSLPGWLAAATWTGNYADLLGVDMGPYGHTWSLAVEEQFYIVWPLMLLAFLRSRRAAASAALLLAFLMMWRWESYTTLSLLYGYVALETAGSAIVAGCVVAMVDDRLSRLVGAICISLLLAIPLAVSFAGGGLWLVLPFLVTPAVAGVVASAGSLRWLAWPPLRFAGVASYSMYLWHEPVSHMIGRPLQPDGVALGAAVGLAAYFVVEAPVMRMRSRQARGQELLREQPASR